MWVVIGIAALLLVGWGLYRWSRYCERLWTECRLLRGMCNETMYTTDDCGRRTDWPACAEYRQACRGDY